MVKIPDDTGAEMSMGQCVPELPLCSTGLFLKCSTFTGNMETIFLAGEDKEPMFFTMTGLGFVSGNKSIAIAISNSPPPPK